MRTLSGKTRYAFLLFFLTHIPITMMIDAQAFIPQRFFASPIRELFKWYCFRFKDSLMTAPHDVWIQAVIACECFLQIPFFFYAVYALWSPDKIDGRGNFRSACLIYGSHTATTLVPILACISQDQATIFLEKVVLLLFYFPYLIFPLWLVFIASVSEDIFGVEISGLKLKDK